MGSALSALQRVYPPLERFEIVPLDAPENEPPIALSRPEIFCDSRPTSRRDQIEGKRRVLPEKNSPQVVLFAEGEYVLSNRLAVRGPGVDESFIYGGRGQSFFEGFYFSPSFVVAGLREKRDRGPGVPNVGFGGPTGLSKG